MELVTILADDRCQVYDAFISEGSNRLKEYLEGVRLIGLAKLEQGRGTAELFDATVKGR